MSTRMRALAQQTASAMLEQTKSVGSVASAAREVASSTQRTLAGLSEQARGAAELARTMDENRRLAAQNAKAVIEQAQAAKEIEKSTLEVTRLALQVANAVAEQNKAIAELSKEGDEVRRIAKQSARALAEQSQVVSTLSSSTLRHTSGLERVVQSVGEQAAGTQQLGQVVADVRGRTRELSGAIGKRSNGLAQRDVAALSAELQSLRQTYLSHADSLAELEARLAGSHPAASSGVAPPAPSNAGAAPPAATRSAEPA